MFDWEGIEYDTANSAHNDILINSNFWLVSEQNSNKFYVLHFDGPSIYDTDFECDNEEHSCFCKSLNLTAHFKSLVRVWVNYIQKAKGCSMLKKEILVVLLRPGDLKKNVLP